MLRSLSLPHRGFLSRDGCLPFLGGQQLGFPQAELWASSSEVS